MFLFNLRNTPRLWIWEASDYAVTNEMSARAANRIIRKAHATSERIPRHHILISELHKYEPDVNRARAQWNFSHWDERNIKDEGMEKKSWMVCTWNRISICIHFDYAAEKNISILVMEWNLIILSEFLSRSLIFWMLARFPGSLGLNEEWSANWIRCGQFNYEPATIILIFRGKIAKATQFAISLIRVNFQNLPSNLILMETRQTWFVMHLDSIAFWQRFQKKLSHLPRVANKHKNVW